MKAMYLKMMFLGQGMICGFDSLRNAAPFAFASAALGTGSGLVSSSFAPSSPSCAACASLFACALPPSSLFCRQLNAHPRKVKQQTGANVALKKRVTVHHFCKKKQHHQSTFSAPSFRTALMHMKGRVVLLMEHLREGNSRQALDQV